MLQEVTYTDGQNSSANWTQWAFKIQCMNLGFEVEGEEKTLRGGDGWI